MATTTMSRKGQITIARHVRDKLRLKTGDKLDVMVEEGRIVIVPSKKPSTSIRGIGKETKKILKTSAAELVRQLRSEDKEEL